MPAKTKRTIIPADPEDIICDTCPTRFPFQGSMEATIDLAATKGWAVYFQRGPGLVTRALCPECFGTPRSRIPAPAVLEGQEDILEQLGVTITPYVERKGRKGREAS